uniref:Uncharacterized protein n=1 Tax=Leishmania guyanensis TaxID=5670 RepID=A0A1E1IZE9_LEIGU|nr:Hypothetical protein BN36_2333050 [Leishmania guyanensis]
MLKHVLLCGVNRRKEMGRGGAYAGSLKEGMRCLACACVRVSLTGRVCVCVLGEFVALQQRHRSKRKT